MNALQYLSALIMVALPLHAVADPEAAGSADLPIAKGDQARNDLSNYVAGLTVH